MFGTNVIDVKTKNDSACIDHIKGTVLKAVAETLAWVLVRLINRSFKLGQFLKPVKAAFVMPIHIG